jgi:hypothetical protein
VLLKDQDISKQLRKLLHGDALSIVDKTFMYFMYPEAEHLRVVLGKASLDNILASDLKHKIEDELVHRGMDAGSALLPLVMFVVMQ